ncbi:hypothetical protein MSG28_000676 [Choristoneura fumiferana]|uniref:Uncharacterized protein n=1 Tax=Choristoneura fumiferana TaxID=7141 RepID=A0ACC0K1R8_CHOFU|nr:hypothetical protein MSG28_000676 [Choristoneura fumiferana]
MLVSFLEKEGLFLMNSIFKKQLQTKWTWQSPDTMTKNEIDFIITDKKRIFGDLERAIEQNRGSKVFVKSLRRSYLTKLTATDGVVVSSRPEILSEIENFYSQATLTRHFTEDLPEVSLNEIAIALKQLKNGKAPREDGITTELLKSGGKPIMKELQNILILFFLIEELQRRGAGFRSVYSTIDHIHTVRQIIQKTEEYNRPLCLAFVDYEKAFGSIEIWSVMESLQRCQVDWRYIQVLRGLYNAATMAVQVQNRQQGDVIFPKLFTNALEDVFKTLDWKGHGININDDIVIVAETLQDLQHMLNGLADSSQRVGLRMNLDKTKVMFNEHVSPEPIAVQGSVLEVVKEFVYLGLTMQLGKNKFEKEANRRIQLGWAAYGKLRRVFTSPIPQSLKTKVFNQCVLPVMTYGAETWTLTVGLVHKFKVAQRAMLGVSLKDRIRNEVIRQRTKVIDIAHRISTVKPRIGKRSVGRPQTRWSDDLRRAAGKSWMRVAEDRAQWRATGEAYVQRKYTKNNASKQTIRVMQISMQARIFAIAQQLRANRNEMRWRGRGSTSCQRVITHFERDCERACRAVLIALVIKPTPAWGVLILTESHLYRGVRRACAERALRAVLLSATPPVPADVNSTSPPPPRLISRECAGGASILESECDSGGHEGSASSTLPAEVDVQLQRLSVVLTGRRAPPPGTARARTSSARPDMEYEPGAESQPNTVGWDDITPSQKDLVGSVQISKPKRMQTAPAEMVSSHPATKLPDMKQNLPATVPLKEEVNDLKTQLNHEAPPVVTVDREIVPDCDRDQNASVTNRFSFSNGNKADIPKHNVPDETVLLENKRTSVPNEEKPHDPSRMPCLVKRFMLSSNVDNHEETVEMILRLGGEVTDLAEAEAEAGADTGDAVPATHLLCTAPARSQRILSSIAAGCWVLHPAYIARSASAGTFLPEEGFEWGNPVAECLPCVGAGERELAAAAHRWRTRRARGLPGPFAGVVALLHVSAARRLLLARFILAGGGRVTDEQPPYSDESITVCFTDPKRYPMKQRDKEWLVSRRVPACAPILLSAFLTESTRPDLLQHCLPEFRPSD